MAFKKSTTRISVTSSKPVRNVFEQAQRKPYVAIALVAIVPLAVLLFLTWQASSASRSKSNPKATVIAVRQTPQEIAEEATALLRSGDTSGFVDLLDTKIKDPNIVNSRGDSLLLVAATLGNANATERLLALGADVNKRNAYTRDTAVLRSVLNDHDEVTRLLIYADADVNLPNNYRQTPMGVAVEKQKGALVDLFLTRGVTAGVDVDTLLRAASQKNYVGVLGMLKGGVSPNAHNKLGNTPLIISASLGDTPSVRSLLAYRANVHAVNNEGNTALLYAARYNHPDTVLALLAPLTMQYRADVNAQNKKGETALHWAVRKGYVSVVKILLAYDADKTLKTKEGLTPMDEAKKYRRTEIINLLQMTPNQVKELFNQTLESKQAAQAAREARQAEAEAAQQQAK